MTQYERMVNGLIYDPSDDEIMKEVGACDDEVGALASSIQNIDGVMLGITIRETETNKFRLSVRSKSPVSAVNFCEKSIPHFFKSDIFL